MLVQLQEKGFYGKQKAIKKSKANLSHYQNITISKNILCKWAKNSPEILINPLHDVA